MGKRGPAPKPTHLKVVEGTYRKDRAAKNEPRPEPGAPNCPTWLHREAKREWRRIVPELERLGLLTELDRAALAAYCQSYADWYEAERRIRRSGTIQVTDTGYIAPHPAVGQKNQAMQRMKQYLALFGLSPSDRTRVSAPEREETSDPLRDFLTGSGG